MARIAGVDLPREKRIAVGLTYIFGIGQSTASKILEQAGVDPHTRVQALTDEQVAQLRGIIENRLKVEGTLRSETSMNIKRLMDIGCFRGWRHRRGLPARGQRTRKGPRKAVAGKKKPPAK